MKTLILGEVIDNKLSSGTLEIVSKANALGLDFRVVTVGSSDAPVIGSSTFQQTYIKRSSESLQFSNIADKLSQIIQEENISLLLAPSTYQSRDLVSFLSVDLSSSPVSNVINFEIEDDSVITTNSINGGESIYKTKIISSHSLLLIRPKSFDPIDIELNSEYQTIEVEDSSVEIFDIFKEEKSGPQLEDSKIVISAGRGMVEKENLSFVEDLANKLNAAIGGTRAIVDAGWMPYSQQVGQTGKTVKPDVYIACGISGATQHQVGMKDSKFIIAINKDEEAPIFQLADLGIVGDTLNIIPKINEKKRIHTNHENVNKSKNDLTIVSSFKGFFDPAPYLQTANDLYFLRFGYFRLVARLLRRRSGQKVISSITGIPYVADDFVDTSLSLLHHLLLTYKSL